MIPPNDTARVRLPSRQSLADSIYEILLDQLIEGEIQAGSAMNIESLSRDLGVSPTPIREALARLEATGLVEREALRGYRAAPLFTMDQLLQLMDARAIVEAPGARLACSNATAPFLAALRDNLSRMRLLEREAGRYGLYRKADEEFHDLIAQQANNPFLFRAYKSLEAHVQRFRLFGAVGRSDVNHAVAEHAMILEAIVSGDADKSYEAMTEHIGSVRARALNDRATVSDVPYGHEKDLH
ncbi:GntR family transcriptional regulator [Microbacterium sp. zg.B48]|uniref:GntR family transcriptional regulator n=1 Tax=Microbacterium sp. zg.B48 TaxID=2969408 RepID=UPI00214C003A|nr:GntR family transcriptional regulator [Microbacterium sp. zg.B48]MCR2762831.1 GntR family transcriptional regulator [Microbacterium sp. zg.B48]